MGTFYTRHAFHTTHNVIEMPKDENGEQKIEWVKDKNGKQVKHRTVNPEMMGVVGAGVGLALEIAGSAAVGYAIEHYVMDKENQINELHKLKINNNDKAFQKSFESINQFISPETTEGIKKQYEQNKEKIDAELRKQAEQDTEKSPWGAVVGGLACFVGLGTGASRLAIDATETKDKSLNPLDIMATGLIAAADVAENVAHKLNKINRTNLAKKYPKATLMTERLPC